MGRLADHIRVVQLKFIPVRGGNGVMLVMVCGGWWLKFIPVRGRKRNHSPYIGFRRAVEIYPREGTETRRMLYCWLISMLKFIPARGWKLPFLRTIPSC